MPDGLRESGVARSRFETPAVTRIDQRMQLVVEPDTETIGPSVHLLLQQPQFMVAAGEGDPQRQTDVCGFLFS